MDRKEYLLRACYELLDKQNKSSYVLNLLSEIVNYDEADCDGHCLMEDIAIELSMPKYKLFDVQCADSGSSWIVKATNKNHARRLITQKEEYQYDKNSEFMIDEIMDLSDNENVYNNGFE